MIRVYGALTLTEYALLGTSVVFPDWKIPCFIAFQVIASGSSLLVNFGMYRTRLGMLSNLDGSLGVKFFAIILLAIFTKHYLVSGLCLLESLLVWYFTVSYKEMYPLPKVTPEKIPQGIPQGERATT